MWKPEDILMLLTAVVLMGLACAVLIDPAVVR